MCSTKWPARLGPDASEVLATALGAVAERSFFAVADPCDDEVFTKLAAASGERWLSASVQFTEPDCSGLLTCVLPEELGQALFHAFAGEDPLDPPPAPPQLFDLIGEFANMICGTWLTRLANRQTFSLGRPSVRWLEPRTAFDSSHAVARFTVNDLPLEIAVRTGAAVQAPRAGARG